MKVVFYALCLSSPWNKLHSVNDANFAYGYIGKDSARKAEFFFFFWIESSRVRSRLAS